MIPSRLITMLRTSVESYQENFTFRQNEFKIRCNIRRTMDTI